MSDRTNTDKLAAANPQTTQTKGGINFAVVIQVY